MQSACVFLSFLICLALSYFYTSSHKRQDLHGVGGGGGEIIKHKTYVLIFSTTFLYETFLIVSRIQRDIINVLRPSRKVPVILIRFC
jgi:hypothetical protein